MPRQMLNYLSSVCCAALLCSLQPAALAMPPKSDIAANSFVYLATNSKGIYGYRFTPSSDQLEPLGLVAEINQPTWLTVSPSHKFLYAVSESGVAGDGAASGAVSSYSIDKLTGKLTFLNQVSGGGKGTTFVTVDKTEKVLLANNFSGGQLMAFLLNPDGSIGQRTAFIQHTGSSILPLQKSAHPHEEVIAADNRHVIVPDLGEDRIYTYLLDAKTGTLEPGTPPFITVPPRFRAQALCLPPQRPLRIRDR